MRRENALLLGVAIAVIGLAIGAWQLLYEELPELPLEPRDSAGQVADVPVPSPASDLDPDLAAGIPIEREEISAVSAASTSEALPDAFARSLTGITGRLLEEDGSPVADVPVELLELATDPFLGSLVSSFENIGSTDHLPGLAAAEGRSDAQGRFRLEGSIPHAFHALGVDLGGPRGTLRLLSIEMVPGELADIGDIVLAPFVTFIGRVEDERGKPVAGARVRVTTLPAIVFQTGLQDLRPESALILAESQQKAVFEIPAAAAAYADRLPIPTTRTAPDGSFRLEGVPRGLVTLVVDKAGHLAALRPRGSGRRPEQDLGKLLLPDGRSVTATVLDTAGKPVVGAEVLAGAMSPLGFLAVAQPAGVTDSMGQFTSHGLALTGGVMVALRIGGGPWMVFYPPEDDELVYHLPAESELVVRLQDEAGEVVPEATLLVREGSLLDEFPVGFSPFQRASRPFEKLEDGVYRTLLPEGRFELLARAEGFAIAYGKVRMTGENAEHTLLFRTAIEVEVQVVDQDTREPIERARVSVAPENGDQVVAEAFTDGDGRATLGSLPAAGVEVVLGAAHPGYATYARALKLPASNPGAVPDPLPMVVLEMNRGGSLEGHIHLGGRPLGESHMIILGRRGGSMRSDIHLDDEMPNFAMSSAGDGTFRYTHLVPGRHRWEVYPPFLLGDPQGFDWENFDPPRLARGYVEIEAGKTAILEIDLAELGSAQGTTRVFGRVSIDGVPLAGAQVRVSSQGSQRTRTDAAGAFDILNAPVGEGYIEIREESETPPRWMTILHRESVQLQTGQPKEVVIELPAPTVLVIQVTGSGGVPVTGCQITLNGVDQDTMSMMLNAQTDSMGRAVLRLMRTGEYVVHAQHEDHGLYSERRKLGSGFSTSLSLRLDLGVPCEGRLEVSSEQPGTTYRALMIERKVDNRFQHVRQVQLEPDAATFKITGLQAGNFRVRLFTNRGRSERIEFELGPGGNTNLYFKFDLN